MTTRTRYPGQRINIRIHNARLPASPGGRSQVPDAVDASGIVTLRVPSRHPATSVPDAQPRPRRSATPQALLDDDWIMMGGRLYFVAGFTRAGLRTGSTSRRWTTAT